MLIHRSSAASRLRAAALAVFLATLAACDRPPTSTPSRAPTPTPTPAASPPLLAPSSTARTAFAASRHGFAFRNHFPGVGLPTAIVGTGSNATDANAFGLCGGMSAAAADFFVAGRPVPPLDAPPARGTPLYEYLYLRQAESIGPGISGALRFVEWMKLSDDELRERTRQELTAIQSAIKSRGIAPIGLVLARFGGPPGARAASDNHQVLATGIVEEDAFVRINIYDPNDPGDDSVRIELDGLTSPSGVVAHRVRQQGKPTSVRGVMLMPYEPRTPP